MVCDSGPAHHAPLSYLLCPTWIRGSAGDITGKASQRIQPPTIPFAGVIPCTGPWGYHPGRGRGGNPLPVDKNHTGPSPGPPRRSGRFRGEGPGRAWPGGWPMHRSPLPHPARASRSSPAPVGGGSAGDSPGKAGPGGASGPVLRRRHPMHQTGGISPGEGPGREPPPRRQKPYWPFPRAPAQERALSW